MQRDWHRIKYPPRGTWSGAIGAALFNGIFAETDRSGTFPEKATQPIWLTNRARAIGAVRDLVVGRREATQTFENARGAVCGHAEYFALAANFQGLIDGARSLLGFGSLTPAASAANPTYVVAAYDGASSERGSGETKPALRAMRPERSKEIAFGQSAARAGFRPAVVHNAIS
jgi:hypothetical protein